MASILKLLTTFYNKLFKKKEVIKEPIQSVKFNYPKSWILPESYSVGFDPFKDITTSVEYVFDIKGNKCYSGDVILFLGTYYILNEVDIINGNKKFIRSGITKVEEIDLNYYITKENNLI